MGLSAATLRKIDAFRSYERARRTMLRKHEALLAITLPPAELPEYARITEEIAAEYEERGT